MAVLDFLKKKSKKVEEAKKPPEIKVEKEITEKKESVKIPQSRPIKTRDRKVDIAYRVLKSPQVTEKSADLTEKNQYTFKVWPEVNKIEIKKAIEGLYNVDVLSVKIIKVPPKKRRLGKILGWRKGYKKAIIKLGEGQKIEVLPR